MLEPADLACGQLSDGEGQVKGDAEPEQYERGGLAATACTGPTATA